LAYDADAIVGGMIGGVGQRMLGGVAKKTAGEFFAAVDDVLTGKAAAPAQPAAAGEPGVLAAAGATTPGVYEAPPTATPPGVPGFVLGAVVGAAAALAGAFVGGWLARRRG
jgi:uncharacterized protein